MGYLQCSMKQHATGMENHVLDKQSLQKQLSLEKPPQKSLERKWYSH